MKKCYLIFLVLIVFSCEAIFVEDISDDSIVLLAPTDNSEVSSGNITFSWQLLNDAELYEVQIATPSFQNATEIVLDSVADSNSVVKNLDIGEYQWRVRAINSEYQTQYNLASFTVN